MGVTSPKHLHASPRDRTASSLRNVTPTLNKPKDPIYSFAVTVLYQQASSVNPFVLKNFLSQKIFSKHMWFLERSLGLLGALKKYGESEQAPIGKNRMSS